MLTPSPQHPLPQQPWLSPATPPLESTAFTPPHTAPSALGPPPPLPDDLAPDLQPLAPDLQPPTSDPQSSAHDLHPPAPDLQSSSPDLQLSAVANDLRLSALDPQPSEQPHSELIVPVSNIPSAPPFLIHLPSAPFKVICCLCFRNSHSTAYKQCPDCYKANGGTNYIDW
jgi:hypothetical protein